ncbi:RsmB/NOP family class I SAM-dependent RNA methyltransferase [Alkalilacustris brevis]|uniref:RsmB/NOP family class I SAM-dependent RNA methyltransferase n=1 Tax=Alkalilacustris brevis TaxID=2026338 RepID=UPI000E0E08D9|nr:RsmB/NOP family class I SAM-dependent RNA methyltransferase [Alkalilacustris brevis]
MTPAARLQAAIEVLDRITAGAPTEQALLNWARSSRFAGSKDRAAVRDHVFDVLRCWRSCAALGGGESGRALIIGALRAAGQDVAEQFSGARHAPPPLTSQEAALLAHQPDLPENVALDCPDWLAPRLRAALGARFAPVMEALRHRAPVFLRANLARASREAARAALAEEGVETRPSAIADTALEVTANARRVQHTQAYLTGLVELQDAASQAVVAALPLRAGQRVLDYCAGGGGKALAMAARAGGAILAHDADPARMADLPARAARAGAAITPLAGDALRAAGPFDLVLLDVPCSGSGSWRRAPEAKWRFTEARLHQLEATQAQILQEGAGLIAPRGLLAYVTCSLLREENEAAVARFLAGAPEWRCTLQRRWLPCDGADGFFLALLTRD